MNVPNRNRIAAGRALAEVGHRIAAEVIAKRKHAAVQVALEAVDLLAAQFEARGPLMVSSYVPQTSRGKSPVPRAVNWNAKSGPQARHHRTGRDQRTRPSLIGNEQRPDAAKTGGKLCACGRGPGARPSKARVVRLGPCVGILAGDKLEGLHRLRSELVEQRKPVRVAQVLVEPGSDVVVVDKLRRVGVEGPRIDVDAVRQCGGKRGKNL